MHSDGVLVRFGEIGIKSAPVRRLMLERLRDNLLAGMEREKVEGDVSLIGARLWMVGPDPMRLLDVAQRTFGVVSASPVRKVAPTIEAIGAAAVPMAMERTGWKTFALRTTRDGEHPFTSQDVGVQVGSLIWKAVEAAGGKPKVDLTKPDLEIFVDVRKGHAFVFRLTVDGPGGIPVGSQGVALALLSDESSFLAAWLMMRRGCAIIGLHAGTTGSIPVDAVAELARWGLDPEVELLPVCTGTVAKPVLLEAAAAVAKSRKAQALVTGDTIDSALVGASLPVLRPVCGLDKGEVQRVRVRAKLPPIDADSILDAGSSETLESMLSMRRTVSP
ncbi:MAG: THUMP domain-containing protein [Candidatus Thermoplasmatota archaeon]